VTHRAQQVRQQARGAEADQHQRDRQLLGGVARAPRRRCQRGADHADRDREHRDVLVGARALAEHPLADEQQHEQAGGERRLHDHQRSQHQGHDLQREAEYRQARAQQPARSPDQAAGERQAEVLLVGRLLGVHRLEGDP